ncbi:MAG: UDP-N-acetylmuramate dehydrogenase [Pseudomonadota bacterium]
MPLYLPHFNLQNHNTLASPVVAQFFVSVKTETELLEAIKFAHEKELPLLVLGGGSNIVLRDDFAGLVLHINLLGKKLVSEDDSFFYVEAAAGENWHEFVTFCLDSHYSGLENLSLIPGSVGAAPVQNIGAYGVELQDVFSELTALDVQSGLAVTFTKSSCQFQYRDSVFKGSLKDKYIITSVTFKLAKKVELKLQYPALQQRLSQYSQGEISPQLVSELVCDIRSDKLPDPHIIPNVGSFFKNPIISATQLLEIQRLHPEIVFYPADSGGVKLAAGWLIDQAGWKGYSDGTAAVHSQQALVLTNPYKHKGDVVLALAQRIQESIFTLFAVHLELEPRVYP